ncbi:hypothetical protein Tco_0548517 [Tanacetum coccineum]
METEAAKCSVERKTFEIKEKEFLLENDRLLKLIISQDLVHIAVNTLAAIADYKHMEKSYLDEYNENLELQAELSKKNEMVEKAVYDELSKKYYLKYTHEHADTLCEIVEHARALRPLDSDLDSACKFVSRVQELLVYVRDTCPSSTRKRLISSTSASGSKPQGNTKKNRISRPTSNNAKHKVEDHLRSIKLSLNKKNRVSEPVCNANVKQSVLNANSKLICATCNECMFDEIHDLCVLDFVNDVNVRAKSKSVKSKKKKV